MDLQKQFEWDGTEDRHQVWQYALSLGPSETARLQTENNAIFEFPLCAADLAAISLHHRHLKSLGFEPLEPSLLPLIQDRLSLLTQRLDAFFSQLSSSPNITFSSSSSSSSNTTTFPSTSSAFWFMKTTRHSPKDAPLDTPSESDLQHFRAEMQLRQLDQPLPREADPDAIDFGPAFEALLCSRLRSLAVAQGSEAVSLLTRSRRIHDDFQLELAENVTLSNPNSAESNSESNLENLPSNTKENKDDEDQTDDDLSGVSLRLLARLLRSTHESRCSALFFSPFDATTSRWPLHEFRVFVVSRRVRAIAQYQHLVASPLAACMAPAAQAMARFVAALLPSVDAIDVAVDVQCVPSGAQQGVFDVRLIEVNPFGPGCVWGVFDWAKDRHWLHGHEAVPESFSVEDTAGGCTAYTRVLEGSDAFLVGFVRRHPLGFVFGGLAHMDVAYFAEIHQMWGLEELLQSNPSPSLKNNQQTVDTSSPQVIESSSYWQCNIL